MFGPGLLTFLTCLILEVDIYKNFSWIIYIFLLVDNFASLKLKRSLQSLLRKDNPSEMFPRQTRVRYWQQRETLKHKDTLFLSLVTNGRGMGRGQILISLNAGTMTLLEITEVGEVSFWTAMYLKTEPTWDVCLQCGNLSFSFYSPDEASYIKQWK